MNPSLVIALSLAAATALGAASGCSDHYARAQPAPDPAPGPVEPGRGETPAPVDGDERARPPAAFEAERQAAAEALNALALKLYADLRAHAGEDDNLFFSPASIQSALALALAGADGETAAAIQRTLSVDGTPQEALAALGALSALFDRDKATDGIELRLANRVWGGKKLPWMDSYLADLRRFFGALPGTVDFRDKPEEARQAINAWVAESTEGLIPELFPQGTITNLTRAVLANAIYFKGDWAHAFSKAATEDLPFHVTPEREVEVPLMYQRGHFRVSTIEGGKVIELPYKGGKASMLVILPDDVDGLAALESQLTPANLTAWTRQMGTTRVDLWLPRFELRYGAQLNEPLERLGMGVAFTNAADFGRMVERGGLKIDKVIHKAFVKVDEEGTEAAAATGITMVGITSTARPAPPLRFRVDHPFLFAIRDNATGSVLFLGRMIDPSA